MTVKCPSDGQWQTVSVTQLRNLNRWGSCFESHSCFVRFVSLGNTLSIRLCVCVSSCVLSHWAVGRIFDKTVPTSPAALAHLWWWQPAGFKKGKQEVEALSNILKHGLRWWACSTWRLTVAFPLCRWWMKIRTAKQGQWKWLSQC